MEETFPYRLLVAMEEADMTDEDICKSTRISVRSIDEFLNDIKVPNYGTLAKLCKCLNTTANFLLAINNKDCFELKESFSERLKLVISERNVSKKKLVFDTGIDNTCVGRYLRGETKPNSRTIKILCEYLNVSADYFLMLD